MLVEESKGALNPEFALKSQGYASKVDVPFSVRSCLWYPGIRKSFLSELGV